MFVNILAKAGNYKLYCPAFKGRAIEYKEPGL